MDAAKQFSTLTHRLKLSTEEATNLFKASAAIGEEFSDVNDTLVGQTMALNSANGLAIAVSYTHLTLPTKLEV